jgi:putative inorganic carbon (hco3(-)) transporter
MDTLGNLASIPDPQSAPLILQKKQWIGAIGFLALLAFTWLPNSYGLMVGWPYILIWQGAFFILGSYTLWLCRQFSIPFKRLGYGLDGIVALTLIAGTLSTINAQFQAIACWNLLLIANYAICLYFLTNWLRHGKLTRHFLWMLLSVTGIITSIIGLALWQPNPDMWLSTNFDSAIRNPHPLGHHNFVGGYELLVLPIVLTFALAQIGRRKWIYSIAAGIVAIALYASGSRGALVGALALSLISGGLGLVLSKKHHRRQWVGAICCLTIVMSLALVSNPRIRTLFNSVPIVEENTISVVSLADAPARDRVFMIEAARKILEAHPILGIGPGNLSRVYNLYRPIETGTGLTIIQQMHNTPAQLAAELGILGLIVYVVLLAILLRLGMLLHKNITELRDRILLYGIGASWFGYAVSSLFDYQLENVGITMMLVVTTALLISLGDAYGHSPENLNLSNRTRRISSLCLLALLCGNFQLWIKNDVGLYLSNAGLKDGQNLDLVAADEKFAKASKLVPWDPTYSALAAETMLNIAADVKSEEEIKELETLAIDYLKETVKAAPNDPWFNQNLAVLLTQYNAKEAEQYAEHAVRLAPRIDNSYTYYTLGTAYLQQNKIEESIDAFVLESLMNPIFLTATLWKKAPFSDIKQDVVEKTLEGYQQILSTTHKNSGEYQWIHEQWTILSWWYDYPITQQDREETRELVHAILIADEDPQKALTLINQYIEAVGSSPDLHLIQARLSPDQYLPSLLVELGGTDEEKSTLTQSIKSKQPMKSWFNAVSGSPQSALRFGASFAYRNLTANVLQKILYPGHLEVGLLPNAVEFFAVAPREYPQLDKYMAALRAEELGIE